MKQQTELGTYLMPRPKVIVSCRGRDGAATTRLSSHTAATAATTRQW